MIDIDMQQPPGRTRGPGAVDLCTSSHYCTLYHAGGGHKAQSITTYTQSTTLMSYYPNYHPSSYDI